MRRFLDRNFFKILLISLCISTTFPLIAPSLPASAQGGETNYLTNCPINSTDPNCTPPTLQQLEFLGVRLLYGLWGCSGLIFMVLFMYIGALYLTSAGDQAQIESAKKRMTQWIIGIFLLFFAQPVVATMMKGLIGGNDCYKGLTDPGFTFFFPTVCTNGDTTASVTPTPALACKDVTGADAACQTACGGSPSSSTTQITTGGKTYNVICACGVPSTSSTCLSITAGTPIPTPTLASCPAAGLACVGNDGAEQRCDGGSGANKAMYCVPNDGRANGGTWQNSPNPQGKLASEDGIGGCCVRNLDCPSSQTCSGTDSACASGNKCQVDSGSPFPIWSNCTPSQSIPSDRCCLTQYNPAKIAQLDTYILLNQDAPSPITNRCVTASYLNLDKSCGLAAEAGLDLYECICGRSQYTFAQTCMQLSTFCAMSGNNTYCACQTPPTVGCITFNTLRSGDNPGPTPPTAQ